MLCRLQLFHQPYEHILSQGKILDVRIFIYRRSSHTLQVIRQSGHTAVPGPQVPSSHPHSGSDRVLFGQWMRRDVWPELWSETASVRKCLKITPNTGITSTGMIQAILKLESIGSFKMAITARALKSTQRYKNNEDTHSKT